MTLTATALAVATVAALATTGGIPPSTEAPSVGRTVVVRAGDTIWDVAERTAPSSDPREVVEQILLANPGVDPGALPVGLRLRLPFGPTSYRS